jgi:hypothetical protein
VDITEDITDIITGTKEQIASATETASAVKK